MSSEDKELNQDYYAPGRQPSSLIRHEPTIMEIIQQIATSPNAKDQVEVMKEMLAMKERMEDREAKRVFIDALTELQKAIPPMHKDSSIIVKGKLRSKYVSIDSMVDVIDPLMHEYGFSFMLSEVAIKDGMREFAGTLLHRGGFEKTVSVHLPLDKSEFRSAVQSEGSTISYARRLLYKAHFNIVERGSDDDGSGQGLATISEEQALDLGAKLDEAKANVAAFKTYFEIEELTNLKQSDLSRAYEMIERKAKK